MEREDNGEDNGEDEWMAKQGWDIYGKGGLNQCFKLV